MPQTKNIKNVRIVILTSPLIELNKLSTAIFNPLFFGIRRSGLTTLKFLNSFVTFVFYVEVKLIKDNITTIKSTLLHGFNR